METKRFELDERLLSIITSVKKMFNADSCALYVMAGREMDADEMQFEFEKRFPNGAPVSVKSRETGSYNVLKFVGVDDYYKDQNNEYSYFWKINYTNRPNKYIIFTKESRTDLLVGEGITGMAARTKKVQYYNKKQIEKCHSDYSNNDTIRGIHPKCIETLAIPILEKNNCVGVVRLDIYERTGKETLVFCKKDKNIAQLVNEIRAGIISSEFYFTINELLKNAISISKEQAKSCSYDALFKGNEILSSIKQIKHRVFCKNIESSMNEKVFESIEHLFFIFKRNAYLGEEQILTRVMLFIQELFDHLGLSEYYSRTNAKLNEFRDHEKFMLYNDEKYRDHFMHQFHVFIVGYIIMNFIGLKKITDILNRKLDNTVNSKKIKLKPDNLLRIWTLASFFHDVTYVLEKYENKIQNFLTKQLNMKIPVNIKWGQLLTDIKDKKYSHIDNLEQIGFLFESPNGPHLTNQNILFKNAIKALQETQDHGVMSALMLVELFLPVFDDRISSGGLEEDDIKKLNSEPVEIYLAALAILIHNPNIFNTLIEKEADMPRKISFESFLLNFFWFIVTPFKNGGEKRK